MLIAHITFGWGESGWLTANTAAEMEAAILKQFGPEAVGFYCTDDDWEGATLTTGNLEQIEPGQTGHWRISNSDKIAIVNLPGIIHAKKSIMDSLRDAVDAAEKDRLCDGLNFSGVYMADIRKDWYGWNFGDCNFEGASFRDCEMGNNDFIDCNMTGCWLPLSETNNIRLTDCVFGA